MLTNITSRKHHAKLLCCTVLLPHRAAWRGTGPARLRDEDIMRLGLTNGVAANASQGCCLSTWPRRQLATDFKKGGDQVVVREQERSMGSGNLCARRTRMAGPIISRQENPVVQELYPIYQ